MKLKQLSRLIHIQLVHLATYHPTIHILIFERISTPVCDASLYKFKQQINWKNHSNVSERLFSRDIRRLWKQFLHWCFINKSVSEWNWKETNEQRKTFHIKIFNGQTWFRLSITCISLDIYRWIRISANVPGVYKLYNWSFILFFSRAKSLSSPYVVCCFSHTFLNFLKIFQSISTAVDEETFKLNWD
jgi:hypothetical protein